MKEFLKYVVEHYISESVVCDGRIYSLGMADYLFVFPNRRSGLFFNKYLFEKVGAPIFAPKMTTISELFPLLNEGTRLCVLDRIEQLFSLYNIYVKVCGSSESFDNFLFWGEMLLGDFDDVDKYFVDARLLFENVRDLKDIEEKFSGLEPEQIKIIRTFWTNFNPDFQGRSKEVFRQTWKILFQLYTEFRMQLFKDSVAYDGMLQRMIIEDLRQKELSSAFDEEKLRLQKLLGKKVVFVGLTALSNADIELMHHLLKYGIAEFCWDYADSRLNDKNSHASYFRAATIENFPNILDEEELRSGLTPDSEKNFVVIEVPSGVGQTVQAANILKQWKTDGQDAFRTAVVLPDERMLMPMLYSVPKEFEPFNVTMGYSLKTTSISTFIDLLAQLQTTIQRNRGGVWTFYYKNVQTLLETNYMQKMCDGRAEEIVKEIVRYNRYRVAQECFKGNLLIEKVFRPCIDGYDCIKYLKEILEIFARQAESEFAKMKEAETQDREDLFGEINASERHQGIFSEVEREFLFSYISLVNSLEEKFRKFNAEINVATFFSLLHKLAQSETVAFSGELLSGLQVMGVLETRGLDFDNLIILSMNEGIFPAKPLTNTFIPTNLRVAFGMPTQAHRDAVFAYHFYRLISRAKNIVMLYDSRSEGMQSGEPSRYIKQLSYLYGIKPQLKTVQYNIGVEEFSPIAVEKDARVMSKLEQCIVGKGNRNLSASVLKHYISCPLRFYFEYIEGLREENEVEETVDDKIFGLILHETMQELYEKAEGREVKSSDLERVIKDRDKLRRTVEKHFCQRMNVDEITGYMMIVMEIILTYVIDILEHDSSVAPFYYLASEKRETYVRTVQDKDGNELYKVNIVAIFDRIDRVGQTLRIVDYKTGKSRIGDRSKLLVPDIKKTFSTNSLCSDEAFQLMLYSSLYNGEENISPNLYFVRDFHINPQLRTELQYEPNSKEPIENFNIYKKEFDEAFDRLLIEIFDSNVRFSQTEDKNRCRYCQFREICKRN